jgi:iron(III) transport system ATP-binding protein
LTWATVVTSTVLPGKTQCRTGKPSRVTANPQTLGITSVYATHDQAEAMTLSDRIVQIGTAQQISRRPATAFVADFIGTANFLSARAVDVSPGRLNLKVLGRQLSIHPPDEILRVGESVALLACPEAILLDVGGEGHQARASRAAYLGPIVEYEVEVAGEVLVLAQYDPGEVYPVGAEVHMQLVKEALYLLPKE